MRAGALILIFLLSSFLGNGQGKLEPYAALHLSSDAGAYFIGPSLMVGADYPVRDHLRVSSYVHCFWDRLYDTYPDGTYDKGKYQSYILALLLEKHLSRSDEKGLFVAGGLAVQRTIEDYHY